MEKGLEIVRVERSADGVFGVLLDRGRVVCCTLEPQDLDNRQNVSCIPPGSYECRRRVSPRFGETFEVRDVPGRSDILFHPGNTGKETSGCILLGCGLGMVGGVRGVTDSRRACAGFMQRLRGVETAALTIRNAG